MEDDSSLKMLSWQSGIGDRSYGTTVSQLTLKSKKTRY